MDLCEYYLFLGLMGLYALLIAYSLFGGWWPLQRQQVRLIWLILVPTALFAALWWVGRLIWALLLWQYYYGDDGGYEEAGRTVSIFVALCVSAVLTARVITGHTKRGHVRNCFIGALLIVLWLAGLHAYTFASRIDGWSARGAAENYAAEYRATDATGKLLEPQWHVVEVEIPVAEGIPKSVRRFVLTDGTTRVLRIDVAPHGWWWWNVGGSSNAAEQFDAAESL